MWEPPGKATHLVVGYLEQDQLTAAKGIQETQGHGGNHSAEEATHYVRSQTAV